MLEKAYIAAPISCVLLMPITIWRPSVTALPTYSQYDCHLSFPSLQLFYHLQFFGCMCAVPLMGCYL